MVLPLPKGEGWGEGEVRVRSSPCAVEDPCKVQSLAAALQRFGSGYAGLRTDAPYFPLSLQGEFKKAALLSLTPLAGCAANARAFNRLITVSRIGLAVLDILEFTCHYI